MPNKPFIGVAAYGVMSQGFKDKHCDKLLDTLDASPRPILSILWGSFGKNNACIRRYLDRFQDRKHALLIHVSNEVCKRSHTCTKLDNYRLPDRLDDIYAVVGPYTQNPLLTLYLSTGLESTFTGIENDERIYEIQRTFPTVVPVINSITNDRDSPGVLHEYHNEREIFGSKTGACNDGVPLDYAVGTNKRRRPRDIVQAARAYLKRNLKRKHRYICLWSPDLQGLRLLADGRPDYDIRPHRRTFAPSLAILDSFKRVISEVK